MRILTLVMAGLFCIMIGLGCQSTNEGAVKGGVIGGLIGAIGGGIIGHQSGHGVEGAAIGAGAGAVTGAIIGNQTGTPGQAATPAQAAPAMSANQMSMQQIVDFTKQGVNEAVIIDRIRMSNSKFNLTAADIDYLKQQGVSLKVIDVMQGQ